MQRSHIENPAIFRILLYSEFWHIKDPMHIHSGIFNNDIYNNINFVFFNLILYTFQWNLKRAIWKSRHQHLGISIGIDVGISIGNFFAFRSLNFCLLTFLVNSFSNTFARFPENVCYCLEQLFCSDVVSACFWRKELPYGHYLTISGVLKTHSWKLQLVCLDIFWKFQNTCKKFGLVLVSGSVANYIL